MAKQMSLFDIAVSIMKGEKLNMDNTLGYHKEYTAKKTTEERRSEMRDEFIIGGLTTEGYTKAEATKVAAKSRPTKKEPKGKGIRTAAEQQAYDRSRSKFRYYVIDHGEKVWENDNSAKTWGKIIKSILGRLNTVAKCEKAIDAIKAHKAVLEDK